MLIFRLGDCSSCKAVFWKVSEMFDISDMCFVDKLYVEELM